MVEQSRSGAYIPVGMACRSQLEATSPWFFAERAKRLHAEDVCPDCAADHGFKRQDSVKASASDRVRDAALRFYDTPEPLVDTKPINAPMTNDKIATATELINDSGAIVVVKHDGIVDLLAVDNRQGSFPRDYSQRLSDNLVKVSKAVAQLGPVDEHPAPLSPATVKSPVTQPEPKRDRGRKIKSCSMSELLEDLHTIAAEMNIDLSGNATRYSDQIQNPNELANPAPTTNAPLPAIPALRKRSQQQPPPITSPSPPSTYVTAPSTRKNSLQAPIELPSSILRAADYSPSPETTAQRPTASRLLKSPLTRSSPQLAPGHYPASPVALPSSSPWAVRSPKPTKRVRILDRWPPEDRRDSTAARSKGAEEVESVRELRETLQEAKEEEVQLLRAVREAAEMERGLRRRVRARWGLGGAWRD